MSISNNQHKHELYKKALERTMNKFSSNHDHDIESLSKIIFYSVRISGTQPKKQTYTREELILDNDRNMGILKMIGILTPTEFMRIFPIAKEYDAKQYYSYFSTIDYLETLPPGKLIGNPEAAFLFLYKYHNEYIDDFITKILCCWSSLRRLEGRPSFAEEYVTENMIKSDTGRIGQNGLKFLKHNETCKSSRVNKQMPRYLKLVK